MYGKQNIEQIEAINNANKNTPIDINILNTAKNIFIPIKNASPSASKVNIIPGILIENPAISKNISPIQDSSINAKLIQ